MEIEAFAKSIRKENEIERRWTVLIMLTFFSAFLLFFGNDESAEGAVDVLFPEKFGYVAMIVLSVIFAANFCHQYTIIREKQPIIKSIFQFSEIMALYEILKPHSFDVKNYFLYIQKKMLIYQVSFLVYGTIIGVYDENTYVMILGVIAAIIPSCVLLIRSKVFEYALSHTGGYFMVIMGSMLHVFRWIIQVMAVFSIWLFSFIIISIVASGFFMGMRLNEGEIIYRSFNSEAALFMLVLIVILIVIFILACMVDLGKKSIVIRIILFAAVIVSAGVNIFFEANCYIDINMSRETIFISDFNEKSEYSFREVSCYEIREESEEYNMWVIFSDMKRVKIIGYSSETYTDEYSELYQNDEAFIKELKKVFKEYGADECE